MSIDVSELSQVKNYIAQLKPTFMGRLFYYCLPFRKKVVIANMNRVFGKHLSPAEIKRLAQAFYSHIATSIKENIAFRFMSQKKIKAQAEVRGLDNLQDIIENNRSMLVLAGHFGNWEFAPIAGILNFKQFQGRFYFIRKTIGAKWLERLLFRRFYQAGLNVIAKKNALTQVTEALDNRAAVVFVLDQHACIGSKDGIKANFFGHPAGTYKSLAMLANYTGVPVVPVTSYRLNSGKHVLEFSQPLEWIDADKAREAIRLNTEQYNRVLEKMVLARPEQWLWMHRRWKLRASEL